MNSTECHNEYKTIIKIEIYNIKYQYCQRSMYNLINYYMMVDLLSVIPHELLSLVLNLLNISSIFSLKLTSKKYQQNNMIYLLLGKTENITSIHLDAISSNGHADLFKWFVRENEVTSVNDITLYAEIAAIYGNLDILVYLYENGSHWSTSYWQYYAGFAIKNDHLEILKYVHENGHRHDNSYYFCDDAAEFGHLEILKYLHEHRYPWHVSTYYGAARNGHLEIIKYLHENECPWDHFAPFFAKLHNRSDVLVYLHKNGCRCQDYECPYCVVST